MVFESFSVGDTEKIAFSLANNAKNGDIYCLEGDLGAGKTAFSRGFAKGLLIDDYITSPTFTILNEYTGRLNLYHFDVYRIENSDKLYDTGYEEYFYGDGVCLVEWASIVKNVIPKNAVWIKIERDETKGEDYRKIIIEEGGV